MKEKKEAPAVNIGMCSSSWSVWSGAHEERENLREFRRGWRSLYELFHLGGRAERKNRE